MLAAFFGTEMTQELMALVIHHCNVLLALSTCVISCELVMSGEDNAGYPGRGLPERPMWPDDSGWPSPTPLSFCPPDEVGKILQMIPERLERIEKQLENIEKALFQRQSTP